MLPWDTICMPKAAGGIDFRDLHHFNIALLGKEIWRLICEPDNLLSQVYKCKYYPTGSVLESSHNRKSSFAWKGISIAISKLRDGFFKHPGISSQVQIHFDKWGGSQPVNLYGDYEVNDEVPLRAGTFMLPNLP